jgi:2-amino-4-hydroxy-6-hydroxymethyldihydropteridine diphosphokinase
LPLRWFPAYVGIGSNLGDPPARVRAAFARLAALPRSRLERRSSLYGSVPMGPIAQADFCNAVVGLLTQLEAPQLHAGLRDIETQLGRESVPQRWGPRVIDLDLLVYADEQRADAQLTLPHPGIAARNFVLQPLCEIAPDLLVPGLGRVAALAARSSATGLWRMA